MATPVHCAPHNGIIGDASGTAASGHINQFLGTHGASVIYQGSALLTPNGSGGLGWGYPLDSQDIDQPFALSGTAVGRVEIPVLAVGSGADLLVSLCADNGSSNPGSVITQTRIPASWITQLSAVTAQSAPSSAYPQLITTGSALATARFNPYRPLPATVVPYAFPAVSSSGTAASPAGAYYDPGTGTAYLYLIGGVNSGLALSSVFSITADSSGAVANAVPQPSLPQLTDGSGKATVAVEPSGTVTVVIAGGATTFGGTPTGAVYTSTVDPATGNLAAWSSQTAFPVPVQNQGMASSGPYVYAVGGISSTSGTVYNTVYYTQVQNSQIASWTATTPLPENIQLPWITVVGGFLFIAGGATTISATATANSYYAPINDDGSLGNWIPGPPLPTAQQNASGIAMQSDEFGTLLPSYPNVSYYIGFTASGPGSTWYTNSFNFGQASNGFLTTGTGTGMIFEVDYIGTPASLTSPLSIVPTISVPVPATGLTSGATYHLVLQQQGGDASDYLVLWDDYNALPIVARTSPRAGNSWAHVTAGHQVPVQVYDQSATGPMLHTWEDTGAKVTTLVHASTPDQRLLGLCEAVAESTALNTNTSFETGISPWTVTGGTRAQATSQVYQGSYSLQITPSGSAANVIAASEIMPCMPGQWITAAARVRFTNAVTSNYSTSIAWYTAVSGGTLISTSAAAVSVAAATWTEQDQTLQAPAGAYGCQIQATLSGTPSAGQVWYLDTARAYPAYAGPQNSTVTEILYPGAWPNATWPPLGTAQLA